MELMTVAMSPKTESIIPPTALPLFDFERLILPVIIPAIEIGNPNSGIIHASRANMPRISDAVAVPCPSSV